MSYSFAYIAMTDPITFTASAIASLAFQKIVEGIGSETGKKFSEKAFGLIDQLRQKIVARFSGRDNVQATLEQAKTGDSDAIAKVAKYLDVEILDAPEFAGELQQLANEITQYVIEDNSTNVQVNYGGENIQNNISGGENYIGQNVTVNKT